MPTVKQLKIAIRNHKKSNCPAISKMKKKELVRIAIKKKVKANPNKKKIK